jgi:hypothetical protein
MLASFVLTSKERFDIITSDPIHPWGVTQTVEWSAPGQVQYVPRGGGGGNDRGGVGR